MFKRPPRDWDVNLILDWTDGDVDCSERSDAWLADRTRSQVLHKHTTHSAVTQFTQKHCKHGRILSKYNTAASLITQGSAYIAKIQ